MNVANLTMGLGGGSGLVLVGVLVWTLTRSAARGDTGPNPVAGIRTATTTASARAWSAGHRAALPLARRLGAVGIVLGVCLVAAGFLPGGAASDPDAPHPVSVALFAAGYGAVLLGGIPLVRTANRAARQAEAER